MRVVVVIPTYNEAENVSRLVPVLDGVFKSSPDHEFIALFVDGNSPDGTAEVVRSLAAAYPFVHLLPETKKAGLGAAYVHGFRHALAEFQPDILVEMDADFQHDPNDLPRLIEPITRGYDYVIGSRFTKGGSIPAGWAFYRKFLSFGGNLFSKIVLGIFNVNDFTTGFKASRVKGFVDKLNLDAIMSKGFAYKMDLLFKMHKAGAKIVELPIKFGLRDRGNSKMELNNPIESLKVVLLLRYNESQSFILFCIVGIVGLAIDTGLFNLLRVTVLTSKLSALASGLVAMLATFVLNNYWSFAERKLAGGRKKLVSLLVYIASSFVPIFIRSKLVGFAAANFGDTFLVSNIAFGIGIIVGLVWNFTVYSKVIWKKG